MKSTTLSFYFPNTKCTGHFYTDEAIFRESGIVDFPHYAVDPDTPLMQALFIPPEEHMTPVSPDLFS